MRDHLAGKYECLLTIKVLLKKATGIIAHTQN